MVRDRASRVDGVAAARPFVDSRAPLSVFGLIPYCPTVDPPPLYAAFRS